LCEEAEYLRVGTTMLVLDAVEAGAMPPVPRVRRPMKAMHAIAADPTLRARVSLWDGSRRTALEIQRFYLDACKQFLARRTDAPAEAWELVGLWGDVLDRLETDPRSLVGRVDWVTKRALLEQCAAGAPWAVRKKIDLRYHELSPEGYFSRLCAAGVVRTVLSEAEIDAARRQPPPDSPATERGRLIRQNAAGGTLKVTWDRVTFGAAGARVE
jgi:proteasome accessory factor A